MCSTLPGPTTVPAAAPRPPRPCASTIAEAATPAATTSATNAALITMCPLTRRDSNSWRWEIALRSSSRFFPRPLRNEREKAPRVVDHDAMQHIVGDAGGFQLRHEHRQRLRVAARGVRREEQPVRKPCLEERHHQRHLLRVAIAAL